MQPYHAWNVLVITAKQSEIQPLDAIIDIIFNDGLFKDKIGN